MQVKGRKLEKPISNCTMNHLLIVSILNSPVTLEYVVLPALDVPLYKYNSRNNSLVLYLIDSVI